MTKFSELGLKEPLMQAVASEGYTTPTPIQAQAIPYLLDGRDLTGLAQTGTGKTAAFTLPMLHRLSESGRRRQNNSPRALVLAPTRELAGQIADSIRTYGHKLEMRYGVVFGGVPINPQIKMLNRGLDILVATPGRLLDLMNQGKCRLDRVEIFILDEADRMLDMGFIHDVKKIIAKVPNNRQTALFSATMPKSVVKLVDELLRDPVGVEVAPTATTAERVDQRVLFVPKDKKRALLTLLLGDNAFRRVLIFSRTKHGANKITEHLERAGVDAAAIHGNKSQTARQRALDGFKSGRVRALVATDIAARGIDVEDVTHVINFDLPNEPESYVHRIGRTARAGASGKAISFCDVTERGFLRDIEKIIRQPVPVDEDHPYHFVMPAGSPDARQRPGGNRTRNPGKKRGRGRRARGLQGARQAA